MKNDIERFPKYIAKKKKVWLQYDFIFLSPKGKVYTELVMVVISRECRPGLSLPIVSVLQYLKLFLQ